MTYSGYTAFMLASKRPKAAMIFHEQQKSAKSTGFGWGVDVFFYNKFVSTDESVDDIIGILKKKKW